MLSLAGGARDLGSGIPGIVQPAPAIVVPTPPTLQATDSEDKHLLLLARAYEGAVYHVYGVRSWAFRSQRCVPAESKFAPMLRAARIWCIEHEVSPVRWCLFAVQRWQATHEGAAAKKPPPVGFVFAAHLMQACLAWVQHDAPSMGGLRVRGPSAQSFFARQTRYVNLLRSTLSPADAVKHVWGTAAEWREALTNAQGECARLREDLQERIANGEWVWREPLRVSVQADGSIKWR